MIQTISSPHALLPQDFLSAWEEMSLAWRNLQKPFYLETSLRILQMRPSLSLGASRIAVPKLTLHTKHSMPPCDFSPEKYQSLAYSRVLAIHKQHLSPVDTAYFRKPLLLHQGHMEWLFDSEGNRYLDFFSGIVTVSVGHCHPKVSAVAKKTDRPPVAYKFCLLPLSDA